MKNTMKKCTKCEEIKPLPEFRAAKGYKDGHRSDCKACESKYKTTFDRKCAQAASMSKFRARKFGVKSTLTVAEVREIFSADSCDYCNAHLEQSEKTLEHVIPFEYCGENTFGNVTLACRDCNGKKHSKPAFEFMLLNGDANAARRLLYVLAERNGIEPQEYLYRLATAGIQYRTARLYRIAGVER